MNKNSYINIIRSKRKERGLTQQELADLIGVSRVTVNYYENSAIIPSNKILIRIIDVLNIHEDLVNSAEQSRIDRSKKDGFKALGFNEEDIKILRRIIENYKAKDHLKPSKSRELDNSS